MGKVSCKILKLDEFTKLVGKPPTGSIVEISRKKAMALIKREVVELSELERDMQGGKKEVLKIDTSPEVIEFLKNPEMLEVLTKRVQDEAVGEEGAIQTLILLIALSKVEEKYSTSANLCMNATSRAGKDFLTNAVLKLVPEKYVFARRRISQKALDYALSDHQDRDWNNYFVYLEDVSAKVIASESVKTLMSANPNKENIVTIVHEGAIKNLIIRGKPTFIMTSAKAKSTDETLGRLPFCYLDETPKQTLAINLKQARDAAVGKKTAVGDIPNFYDGLEPCTVSVPFAEDIAMALSKHWIEKSKRCQVIQRSIFPRFLDYIKGSACLFQKQRKKDPQGNVVAEAPSDYNYARKTLLQTTSNALMIPLSHEEKELIETLEKEFPSGATIKDINLKISRWGERWLRSILDRLAQLGFLDKEKTAVDGSDKPSVAYVPVPNVLVFTMPTWKELNVKKNSIGSLGSFTTNGSIASIGKEVKQMNSKSVNKKHEKKPKTDPEPVPTEPLPADWKPEKIEYTDDFMPWNKGLNKKKEAGSQ